MGQPTTANSLQHTIACYFAVLRLKWKTYAGALPRWAKQEDIWKHGYHSNYHNVFICLREKEQAELTVRRYLGASERLMSHYYPWRIIQGSDREREYGILRNVGRYSLVWVSHSSCLSKSSNVFLPDSVYKPSWSGCAQSEFKVRASQVAVRGTNE